MKSPYFFIKNEKGKIEFTEKELQDLLENVYNDGKYIGALQACQPYVWNPSLTGDKWPTDKWTITTSDMTPSFTTGTITLKEEK